MTTKYLDANGLTYLLSALRPSTNPADLGTSAVGSSKQFAKADHVHKLPSASDVGAASSSHTHGNITNAGALQTNDISIASGDKLVVTDSSDSNKVARSSLSFDGSTTTKYLSKKGTFEDVPTSTQEVFIAGFGETSFADIYDAVDAGKLVFMSRNGTSDLSAGICPFIGFSAVVVGDVAMGEEEESVAYANFVGVPTYDSYSLGTYSVDDNSDDWTTDEVYYAALSHTHGNIQNGGTLQSSDVTVASGDKLVITDSSDSSKVARASISFDGSTTTKALTQKGTWETFVNLSSSQALTNKTYNGYTLAGACEKGVVTTISADSTDLPTVNAVKAYVSTAVSGGAAFQGTAPVSFAPTNYTAGWYWVVGTAGTYAGQTCEAGDMIFATANGTTYSASDFDVIQTNLDITAITNAEIDTIVAA